MKNTLLILAMIASLTSRADAQTLQFGPEAGVNFNQFNIQSPFFTYNQTTNTGLRIGALMDIQIGPIYIQPGLFYSRKGGEREFSDVFNRYKVKTNLDYLEIPFLIQYKYEVGPGKIFIGGGPTADIALDGNIKTTTNPNGGTEFITKQDMDFGDGQFEYNRGDICLMFNLGYEFDIGAFIRPFYSHGLTNIYNERNIKINNRTFGISAGFLF